ncbi:MAG: type II toxin-antitoxin system VapC family toxin [Acidimicrobiales bacterium]
MRVVADSHALVWFSQTSPQLSARASEALREAEAGDGIVVSVASLVDLWYVTQSTQGVSTQQLSELRVLMTATSSIHVHPIDLDVADAFATISRDVLSDPWDRFIVATAVVLGVPLVTRDGPIQGCGLVETVW